MCRRALFDNLSKDIVLDNKVVLTGIDVLVVMRVHVFYRCQVSQVGHTRCQATVQGAQAWRSDLGVTLFRLPFTKVGGNTQWLVASGYDRRQAGPTALKKTRLLSLQTVHIEQLRAGISQWISLEVQGEGSQSRRICKACKRMGPAVTNCIVL